jgi:hypothetical protein
LPVVFVDVHSEMKSIPKFADVSLVTSVDLGPKLGIFCLVSFLVVSSEIRRFLTCDVGEFVTVIWEMI